ncbi:uncharacterized protein LOC115889500 [Sitophilus oryzae]|uniref:Uncharacterized protein LOC115889500 n=1 Tax=Sitophilus oryzae TaxID=7048 RepID=A0A6J2YN08_SITOR|nr:uncharacterized protein LOC115889500 [Sitophilus oryzae]
MSNLFENANFANISHREAAFLNELDSLKINNDEVLKSQSNTSTSNPKDLCISSFEDVIFAAKDQKSKNYELIREERSCVRDTNKISKSIQSLIETKMKLDEDSNIEMSELKNTMSILKKVVKKYATNFRIYINSVEETTADIFRAQVTVENIDGSKSFHITVNRKEREIIDVNSLSTEELKNIKNDLYMQNGFNIGLLLQFLK